MRALVEGRDNNPTHKDFFNSLISDLKLKKKNMCWDRTSVDGGGSTARMQGYSLGRKLGMKNV